MAGVDTNLSAAALAISLVAFFIALGQLLQQYFATADGYRRCQRSVMGGWAKKTRLRWRWREFRFETLYTTPEILFEEETNLLGLADKPVRINGSDTSAALSFIDGDNSWLLNNSHERASWLTLLESLHYSAHTLGLSSETLKSSRVPSIRLQENSWDFQLPDVVRPLAKTSVWTLAVIARRLGMRWKEFDPVRGTMRAEGNGQIITATTIRSLGTVIQYTDTNTRWRDEVSQEDYIPVEAADSLGFGRLRCLSEYRRKTGNILALGTRQQVLAAIRILEPSGHCATVLQALYEQDPNYDLRVGSLVAILADMIRPKDVHLTQIPAPSGNVLGFTQSSQGRYIFRKQLEEYCKSLETEGKIVGDRTKDVLSWMQKFSETFDGPTSIQREAEAPQTSTNRRGEKDRCPDPMRCHDDYFDYIFTKAYHSASFPVLSAYILYGVFRDNGETSLLNSKSPDYSSEIAGYFDAWPKMAEALIKEAKSSNVRTRNFISQTPEELESFFFGEWVATLFRGCLWGACHDFVPGERVPSEWWGSEMPIYIG